MSDYSLKTLMMESNPTVVFRGIAGSHAYGTNNAQSDVDIRGVFRDGQLVVSPVEEVDGDRRVGILIFNRQGFESAKRQHREYWEWKRNRNESRWIQQERGELDFDAKNMMHLMRMLISGENIVQHGEPIVRFAGEKLEMLLAIRRGEWSFEKILECAENIKARIEAGKNRLPKDVDEEKINELIAEAMKLTEVR